MDEIYRVLLWCPDCTDIDPQGCFEGGTAYLEDDQGLIRIFATIEEAQDAGRAAIVHTIWHYEVHGQEEYDRQLGKEHHT